MEQADIHGFSSDRPITEVSQDLLGRSGFAKDLAKALSGWHGNDSLVVALHGDWGSGKSSIVKVLLRLVNPCNGNIFIDDINYH